MSVEPHILVDVMQDDLDIRSTIQSGSDGPQSSQKAFHGRVIRSVKKPTDGLQRVRVNVNLRQLGKKITGPSHCLRHGEQLNIIRSAKPTSMPLLMDILPESLCMPGRNGLQWKERFGCVTDQGNLVWRGGGHGKRLLESPLACSTELGDLTSPLLRRKGDVIHNATWVPVNNLVPRSGKLIVRNPIISAQILIGPHFGDRGADEGLFP